MIEEPASDPAFSSPRLRSGLRLYAYGVWTGLRRRRDGQQVAGRTQRCNSGRLWVGIGLLTRRAFRVPFQNYPV